MRKLILLAIALHLTGCAYGAAFAKGFADAGRNQPTQQQAMDCQTTCQNSGPGWPTTCQTHCY